MSTQCETLFDPPVPDDGQDWAEVIARFARADVGVDALAAFIKFID